MSRPKGRPSAAIRAAQRWLRRLVHILWRVACAILVGGATMGPPPPPPPPPPEIVCVAEDLSASDGSEGIE